MTPNRVGWMALAGLAAFAAVAGLASAEYYEGKPDCPPDMFCTLDGPSEGDGASGPDQHANATDEDGDRCKDCFEPARPGEDCVDDQPCPRGDAADEPIAYDPDCEGEACSHANKPVDGGTCMDGTDLGEDCRDDVQYIGGPSGGSGTAPPTGDGRESVAAAEQARTVPALGGLALLGVGAAVALLGLRKR